MKHWAKIATAIVVIVAGYYAYRYWTSHSLRASVEATRNQLRNQNFRTELTDFNFSLPAEMSARANAIISAGQAVRGLRHANDLDFMQTIGTNVALAVSPIAIIETFQATNLWPLVRSDLAKHDEELNRACAALTGSPLRFQPTARPGGDMLLPYLTDYKTLARALAARAVLTMHEHHTNAVFTNLSALSRMVTCWSPEPLEISHMVRFAVERIAMQALWESMQTDCWNETELATLQRAWESVSFFDGLPETMEVACGTMVGMCRAARNERYSANLGGWGTFFRGALNSPKNGLQSLWWAFQGYLQHTSYRNRGSYEDERALLIYYHERNQVLKRASACPTWMEMRSLPGATNIVVFQGAKRSRIQAIMNLKQLSVAWQGAGQGPTLLARAATAEADRRLIVTAIALERYAIKHRGYPQSLADIVPAYLSDIPLDFMDGKPLRYWRLEDGRYLLYSVGLDCTDNGGQMITLEHLSTRYLPTGGTTILPHWGTDLVWPLRATQTDVDLFEQQRSEYRKEFPTAPREFWERSEENTAAKPNVPRSPVTPMEKED